MVSCSRQALGRGPGCLKVSHHQRQRLHPDASDLSNDETLRGRSGSSPPPLSWSCSARISASMPLTTACAAFYPIDLGLAAIDHHRFDLKLALDFVLAQGIKHAQDFPLGFKMQREGSRTEGDTLELLKSLPMKSSRSRIPAKTFAFS